MTSPDAPASELARLRARVDALERAVQAIAAGRPVPTVPAHSEPPAHTAGPPAATVSAATVPAPAGPPSATGASAAVNPADVFWALNALKAQAPAPGAVLYTGSVALPGGGVTDWQYALPTDELLARDWSLPASAAALAALGHPVRLRLLQAIARGTVAVAELAALEGVGTTGQVYHHVNQLINAGWVYSTSRGHYGIPPERVVPLLVVVLAAGGI